jgi:carbamoylphosphate synthase large subunit
MRVLVTSSGAGPAIALIKALKALDTDHDRVVLATDMSRSSAGLYLADTFRLTSSMSSHEFVPQLLQICRELNIQMVIPVLDGDALKLSAARDEFAAAGVVVACNMPHSIQSANDKLLSFQVCDKAGIRQPELYASPDAVPESALPILAKPRQGVSARGIIRFDTGSALRSFQGNPSEFLWQRFIPGSEYTVDTFSKPSAGDFIAVPRLRKVVKAGQMVQGETIYDPEIIEFAGRCCEAFDISDVACVQVIRHEATGELFFVEINPRYGTGVSLSIAAGVFFPRLQYQKHVLRKPIEVHPDGFVSGLQVFRFWQEVYLYPGQDAAVVGHMLAGAGKDTKGR